MGHGGGQVVSMLALNPDDTSSDPVEDCNCNCKKCFKRSKINKKRPEMAR